MLGHLVSNNAAPVAHRPPSRNWLRRLVAFLLRRP